MKTNEEIIDDFKKWVDKKGENDDEKSFIRYIKSSNPSIEYLISAVSFFSGYREAEKNTFTPEEIKEKLAGKFTVNVIDGIMKELLND